MNFLGLKIEERASDPAAYNESLWTGDVRWSELPNFFSSVANPEFAMKSAAIYSCVRLIAESIGSLPLIIYEKLPGGGKREAVDHPLYLVLNMFPNAINTRMEFVEMYCWHALLRGNAYLKINTQPGGALTLDALNPDHVRVLVKDNNTLSYVYALPGKKQITYSSMEICHIRLHSRDGVVGRSPIQVAREAMFRAVTLEEFHSNTYKNGVKPSGVLEHPKTLTKEASDRLSKSFSNAFSGSMNAGKVPILEEGIKFNAFTMTMEDAEFIAGRKLTRGEVAGIFGVPPHMIGDLDRATFSNIEQQSIQFVVHCIRPYLVRIEQALARDLLADFEQEKFFIEFNVDALMRGDTTARFLSYQLGLQNGFIKFNEARSRENLNPLPWGEATMVPANMKVVRDESDLDQPDPAAPAGAGGGSDVGDDGSDGSDTGSEQKSAREILKLVAPEQQKYWIRALMESDSLEADDYAELKRVVEDNVVRLWRVYQTCRALDSLRVSSFEPSLIALEKTGALIKDHVQRSMKTESHVSYIAEEFVRLIALSADEEEKNVA